MLRVVVGHLIILAHLIMALDFKLMVMGRLRGRCFHASSVAKIYDCGDATWGRIVGIQVEWTRAFVSILGAGSLCDFPSLR